MKQKKPRGGWFVAVLGLALILAAIVPIRMAGDTLVYVALDPAKGEDIERLVAAKTAPMKLISDTLEAAAVGALKTGAGVSAEGGTSAAAAMYGIDEGWFEVYPEYLASGRRITETEMQNGDPVAMLDASLAFQLFPTKDPIDQKITVDGVELRVVGTVAHTRGIGEADLYRLFAPLLAVKEAGFETVSVSAKPIANSGASVMFEPTLRENWLSGGVFYNMAKESMRCILPLRLLALLFGVAVLVSAFRRAARFSAGRYAIVRDKLEREYAARLIPCFLGNAALCAALFAAVFGCAYLLAYWSVQPLYVFTEWVPENIVQWSSIKSVFWNLVARDAALVAVSTPRVQALRFFGGLVRWGTLLVLCGTLLIAMGKRGEQKAA